MNQLILTDLKSILDSNRCSYELIRQDHQIKTAQEGADYFGIEIGQTAPTLVLKTDHGFYALIVSGDREKIDFKDVAAILGCNKVKLASPQEVKEVTGYQVGNVSMLLPLPYLIDEQLKRYPYVYGGTGIEGWTLKIEPKALEALNNVVGYF